ncbi:pyridoxamine 5'-phosphate oxidase family protein [Aquipuribacter sp. SD81]|uniref:pyridoxamine 5'-phosphate oxidase family protein n=1 Tax=Aquipuribacter sp. SD81 TaxID=3127703 RepID=UPI003019F6B6
MTGGATAQPDGAAARTRVRRLPHKQVHDVAARDALLRDALVAHVGVGLGTQPLVLPLAVAPDRGDGEDGDGPFERLLLHGSTGSRLFRALAEGAPACVTVTALDGLVLARSRFESSMRYRCLVALGRCEVLTGRAAERGLEVLTTHLLPGRTEARPPSRKELAATRVLALPLSEWSLKVSDDGPEDDPADLDLPVWAGVVPLHHVWGEPEPAPDLPPGLPVPPYLATWPGGRT